MYERDFHLPFLKGTVRSSSMHYRKTRCTDTPRKHYRAPKSSFLLCTRRTAITGQHVLGFFFQGYKNLGALLCSDITRSKEGRENKRVREKQERLLLAFTESQNAFFNFTLGSETFTTIHGYV